MKQRYGPYKSALGHVFYIVYEADGTKRSVWEHREIMERHLGRALRDDEVVHHRNHDTGDNRIENLEVKDARQHVADHMREDRPPETVEVVCPECGDRVVLLARWVRNNQQKQGKAGPFCGRRCAGRYGARIGGRGRPKAKPG